MELTTGGAALKAFNKRTYLYNLRELFQNIQNRVSMKMASYSWLLAAPESIILWN
jgi:hypothetical protein